MSATAQHSEAQLAEPSAETHITLDLTLPEADALRGWLLKASSDGMTSLDNELVSTVLADLGRSLDAVQAIVNVRHELHDAGINVADMSDNQVLELARRVSHAASSLIRD